MTKLKGARISFSHRVMRDADNHLLVTGVTDMACVNDKMRPMPIPEQIMNRLSNIVEA